jgi:hypothetical protein
MTAYQKPEWSLDEWMSVEAYEQADSETKALVESEMANKNAFIRPDTNVIYRMNKIIEG